MMPTCFPLAKSDEETLNLVLCASKRRKRERIESISLAATSTAKHSPQQRTLTLSIWLLSSRASLMVMEQAMTGRDTPHARPRAVLEGTKT